MTLQQMKTVRRLGIASVLFALWVLFLLYIEFAAVAQGGHSTISELFWLAWATQPGAICLVVILLVFAVGVLWGHFTWQSNRTMDRIRKGE